VWQSQKIYSSGADGAVQLSIKGPACCVWKFLIEAEETAAEFLFMMKTLYFHHNNK
jgi:hypothetical protein